MWLPVGCIGAWERVSSASGGGSEIVFRGDGEFFGVEGSVVFLRLLLPDEQIDFGDAAELLGKDGLQAIANTMAQFRR